jgi:glutathione synthase/RimK-type ligase-like ATP-grasp enzyme
MSLDAHLVALIEVIAPELGATLTVEPIYRRSGMLRFAGGAVLFFRNNSLNINVAGNARMAADKSYLSSFLAGMGFRTLPEIAVARRDVRHGEISPALLADVLAFAAGNDWRVIVKPNALSQGRGVRLTQGRDALLAAVHETLALDRVCVVQQFCAMPEYRIVVLDGQVLQAYRRQRLTVTGDGRSTVAELAARKIAAVTGARNESGGAALLAATESIRAARGGAMSDVVAAGEDLAVADIGNLSAGGEATDVLDNLNPHWQALACELASRCGLLLCGVDIFIADIGDPSSDYRVIELNSAPGLDDYLLSGGAQRERVKQLYRQVLVTAERTMAAAAKA